MNENKQTLTASHINYLIVLYRLDGGDKGIRCVDIAKALGISKPSVHKMMNILSTMKLVKKTKYGTVFLMEDGKNTATQYNQYYEIMRGYFEECFRLSHNEAKRSALAVLSELSTDNTQNVCEQINKLRAGVESVF